MDQARLAAAEFLKTANRRDEFFIVFLAINWNWRLTSALQSSQDVEELIRATDHERASYIRTYYGCDWKDPHRYHMMIGSQIGAEMASWIIVNAVKGVGRP